MNALTITPVTCTHRRIRGILYRVESQLLLLDKEILGHIHYVIASGNWYLEVATGGMHWVGDHDTIDNGTATDAALDMLEYLTPAY